MDPYTISEMEEELTSQREELTAAMEHVQNQNQELENQLNISRKRQAELDEIIYRFHHDLKSPLSTLAGLFSISEHMERDEFISKAKSCVSSMQQNLDAVIRFSNSLRIPKQIEELQIETLDNDIRTWFTEKFSLNNSNLHLHFENGVSIPMSQDHFLTALKELIRNSVVFQSQKVNVKVKTNSKYLLLEIIDNGMGMDKDVLKRCTEMFYKGSSLSKGMGLGLYIVENVISIYNGEIQIMSKPEIGTTVFIQVPLP